MIRALAVVTLGLIVIGCTDVRDFEGTWTGPRVGDDPVLRAGFDESSTATLAIDDVDLNRFRATLTTSGDEFTGAPIQELPAIEADSLAELTFETGQPARIYVTLVSAGDDQGDATAFISLHREDRVELRLVRGGAVPLYGIFFLARP
jgi:hypothetical protein